MPKPTRNEKRSGRRFRKENVIIGRLIIPAGTGFKGSPKEKLVNRYAPVDHADVVSEKETV